MDKKNRIIFLIKFLLASVSLVNMFAQEEEPIFYYQMEPLDDSLFINIQSELFIDPPDPKAEIVVDLRKATDQTSL